MRDQPELFGHVASHATVWRTLEAVAADDLGGVDGIRAARTAARAVAWQQAGVPTVDGMVVIDIDATLVTAHSDKDRAAGTYKGGFGFYPLLSFVDHGDGTGEPLAGVLRPGNAGSNTVIDHDDVLTLTLDQLPVTPAQTPVLVRVDSAGASHGFVDALRDANIMFSVGFPVDERVRAAVLALPDVAWVHARTQDGDVRDGAAVAQLHGLDLTGWPPGTTAIARREPLHPGAQASFLDADGHRVTVFITDQPDADIVELERRRRPRPPTPRPPATHLAVDGRPARRLPPSPGHPRALLTLRPILQNRPHAHRWHQRRPLPRAPTTRRMTTQPPFSPTRSPHDCSPLQPAARPELTDNRG